MSLPNPLRIDDPVGSHVPKPDHDEIIRHRSASYPFLPSSPSDLDGSAAVCHFSHLSLIDRRYLG